LIESVARLLNASMLQTLTLPPLTVIGV
jgi:hypothetical protein